ncbi:4Fe-4S dicluster domain-containing protein [Vibrio sp. SS-MA-C1-2]|uniref:sulfate reduction electron transfer complex DsrMKJOP subunit DsrO n=1 Tax=Vibrio sp. SS-MA-C1-2 TaxID=2908646 RepID=UPI001F42C2BB|nr:4Fe-4S dicluster domain-containing protein [Vibrio sp. SS-MA-C1-2]UJF17340.1 4Fe-4S dicluster domain-containing protein [Vibrio sp. SS-MA-C1-2]
MSEENKTKVSRRQLLSKLALGAAAVQATSVMAKTGNKNTPNTQKTSNHHWGMVIDLRKCIGCQACTVACKIENNAPVGKFRTWVSDIEVKTFPETKREFLPHLCNHCDNPSCVPVCPTGATFKREDGIVLIDNEKCWGCGACVTACPYDVRFINQETKTADKCTFCAHRLEQGLLPACAETCVGGARIFGDLNDKNSEVSQLIKKHPTSVLKPETGNNPNVFYIGLDNLATVARQAKDNNWATEFEEVFGEELLFKGAK